jgi:hypothetical protein
MRYLLAVILAVVVVNPVGAKPTPVRTLQSWSGEMPPGVPPLFQSSVATAEDLQRIWTMCQVKGAPPKVDFRKRIVVVAVRNGGSARFSNLTLDNGTLKTNVVVTPDSAQRQACALALVNRVGITSVNGVPIGK